MPHLGLHVNHWAKLYVVNIIMLVANKYHGRTINAKLYNCSLTITDITASHFLKVSIGIKRLQKGQHNFMDKLVLLLLQANIMFIM